MKSYIADTLVGIFSFDDTGNVLNFIDFENNNQKIIQFYVDIEIKLCQKHYEFRWSVDLMTDDVTYGFSAPTLEEALTGAAERLRNGK